MILFRIEKINHNHIKLFELIVIYNKKYSGLLIDRPKKRQAGRSPKIKPRPINAEQTQLAFREQVDSHKYKTISKQPGHALAAIDAVRGHRIRSIGICVISNRARSQSIGFSSRSIDSIYNNNNKNIGRHTLPVTFSF